MKSKSRETSDQNDTSGLWLSSVSLVGQSDCMLYNGEKGNAQEKRLISNWLTKGEALCETGAATEFLM